MINLGNVWGVARAEIRLTRRLVRFWVFAVIAGLFCFWVFFWFWFIHFMFSAGSASAASASQLERTPPPSPPKAAIRIVKIPASLMRLRSLATSHLEGNRSPLGARGSGAGQISLDFG